MMWNTGIGPGMWLMMAVGTVAFWLLVAWAVREIFTPHEHAKRVLRHAGDLDDGSQPQGRTRDGDRDLRELYNERIEYPRATPTSPTSPSPQPGPLQVLEQRLARGEIDVDEYARIRRALIESNPALGPDAGVTRP